MRRLILSISAVFMAVLFFLGPATGFAYEYEEEEVENGGTLTGTISLKGEIPVPRTFPLVLYPFGTFCVKNKRISDGKGFIYLREFKVGPEKGLGDVVISIENIKEGKKFPPMDFEILTENCEFLPFVTIIRDGSRMTVVNKDPLIHNSQVYQAEKGNVILNVPIAPNVTSTHTIEFQKNRRVFQMICGFHEFMQVWGFAVKNPYNDLSDREGHFSIDQIPPGKYKVIAWHPQFKKVTKEIKIKPGQKVSLNFEFDSVEVIRPNYETQEKFRIGPKGDRNSH